jgi:hypothetical protein
MPQGNPFNSTNRNQMGSNYLTDGNQGGGDKKAGTVCNRVGISTWGKQVLRCTNFAGGYCCGVAGMAFTVNPTVRQSRPIGTVVPVPYWDKNNTK